MDLLHFSKQGSISPIRRIMQMRVKIFLNVALVLLMIVCAGNLYAQDRGTNSTIGTQGEYVEAFGVPLAPGIWLANLMLLYFSKPEIADDMPAYRAALPQKVYECLVENQEGCPYTDMAKYFAEQALEIGGSRNKNTFWPSSCQVDARWQALAPNEYRKPDQLNQPLGAKEADRLAEFLGMGQHMILTDKQYKCMVGIDPPSDEYGRKTIRACLHDLTNSKGNAAIPLSSYGLSINEQGYVRSNCAPDAPCLEFNELALNGSLWNIAKECGFVPKLLLMLDPEQTPFIKLLLEGVECQRDWVPSCIVENRLPRQDGYRVNE